MAVSFTKPTGIGTLTDFIWVIGAAILPFDFRN